MHQQRILCGLLGALGMVLVSGVRADDAVTLTRVYKEGDTARYKRVLKLTAQGTDVVGKSTVKVVVKSVSPAGEVVIEQTDEGGTLDYGGQQRDQPATPPVTQTYDKSGKMTDYKTDMPDAGFMSLPIMNLLSLVNHVLLPDKPVKTGDTWDTQVDNPAVKGKKITIKDTYLGTEKHDGQTLWKIKQTAEADTAEDGSKMSSELTTLIDPATGQEVTSTSDAKDVPTQFGPLSWTIESTLIKPDADKSVADKKP